MPETFRFINDGFGGHLILRPIPSEMIGVTIGHCVEPSFWDRVGHMIPEHNKIMQNTFWGGLGL